MPSYNSWVAVTRNRALGNHHVMDVGVNLLSSWKGGREREKAWMRFYIHKEGDLTHTQHNLPTYTIKPGSSACPGEGDLEGWIKEGEIILHNPIYFLHLIIKRHLIHKIPPIKYTMSLFLGAPCQGSNTPDCWVF